MNRDMDPVRLILSHIEDQYLSTGVYDLAIDGHDTEMVSYHSTTLYAVGLISICQAQCADNVIYVFGVGSLTWDGNDFLEKIRDDSQWKKVKETITKKGLPLVVDTIKSVANALISATVEGITNSIMKGN